MRFLERAKRVIGMNTYACTCESTEYHSSWLALPVELLSEFLSLIFFFCILHILYNG